jgi:hypothetical protein
MILNGSTLSDMGGVRAIVENPHLFDKYNLNNQPTLCVGKNVLLGFSGGDLPNRATGTRPGLERRLLPVPLHTVRVYGDVCSFWSGFSC